MNLILCEPHEVRDDGSVHLMDGRATHVRTVLRASVGDSVRIGIVDGPIGRGEIVAIDNGGDTGGDTGGVTLRCAFEPSAPPRPAVDLLLALPRPKVMRRLWAQLAALGVGRIILTNAERVERHYFDTHILDEATYRPLLIEGLQQACDTRLPRVSIHRQFRVLIEDELDTLSNDGVRLAAHPYADRDQDEDPPRSGRPTLSSPRALLAIGPEGGWNAFELTLLRRHRFEPISLGPRILRTDTACIALLALLHETLRGRQTIAASRRPHAEGLYGLLG